MRTVCKIKARKRPRKLARLRERDGDACHWCGKPMLFGAAHKNNDWQASFDHLVTVAEGGGNEDNNLVLAHRYCNAVRHHPPRRMKQWPD